MKLDAGSCCPIASASVARLNACSVARSGPCCPTRPSMAIQCFWRGAVENVRANGRSPQMNSKPLSGGVVSKTAARRAWNGADRNGPFARSFELTASLAITPVQNSSIAAVHMRQRAEAVELYLVQPVGMVEWLRSKRIGLRLDGKR